MILQETGDRIKKEREKTMRKKNRPCKSGIYYI
jgi:hypothetical protein